MATEIPLASWDEQSEIGTRTRELADLAADAMGTRRSVLLEAVSIMLGRPDDIGLAEAYVNREPYWRAW